MIIIEKKFEISGVALENTRIIDSENEADAINLRDEICNVLKVHDPGVIFLYRGELDELNAFVTGAEDV